MKTALYRFSQEHPYLLALILIPLEIGIGFFGTLMLLGGIR